MATHIMCAFDKNYLTRAIAMYRSFAPHVPGAHYWFLCLDNETKPMMQKFNLPNVTCFTVEEMGNQELLSKRAERNNIEFAMTSKSNVLSYLLNTGKVKDGDLLVLSDVDIVFYPNIAELFRKEMADPKHSIFITPHKFPKYKEHLIPEVGFYNLGFISFRIDEASRKCIHTWAKQCINWCFLWHDYEHNWHTDQMYGDKWKQEYPGKVCDLPDKGVNVGTWNIERFRVTRDASGAFFMDGEPLVCFHFHGLKMYLNGKNQVRFYPVSVWNEPIYAEYLKDMQRAYEEVLRIDPAWRFGFSKKLDFLRLVKQTVTKKFRLMRPVKR